MGRASKKNTNKLFSRQMNKIAEQTSKTTKKMYKMNTTNSMFPPELYIKLTLQAMLTTTSKEVRNVWRFDKRKLG